MQENLAYRTGKKIMPNELLNKIINLLDNEAELFDSLLKVLKEEGRAASNANLKALNGAVERKENIIAKIRTLEKERGQVLEKLAESMSLSTDELTLSKLARMSEEPYSSRLLITRSKLSNLTREIQITNKNNSSLIRYSLEIVRNLLSMFGNLVSTEKVYFQTGEIKKSEKTGILFCSKI